MEHIIEKLLTAFERGKMNRRQLVQSLALAASVAEAVKAAPEEKGFQAATVNHISYQVADYAKTRDFYVDLMGMRAFQDNGRQCYLAFGNTFLLPRNAREGAKTPNIDHVAYTIETWDKDVVEAELKRRGLPVRPDTPDSFHTKDPDGFDLQICGKGMSAEKVYKQ
jgi:catechol 2,3-dioxygenase-like lactoylglutathione lyase family enzyme